MRISGALIAAALGLAGCGSIAYDDGAPSETVVTTTTTGGYYVTQPAPAQPAPAVGPYVTVVPAAPAPVAQPMPAPPPVAAPMPGRVQCGANDHVRIDGQVIDGGNGPAVVASGGCVVDIRESILRGVPAVVALDGAQVVLRESRIQGGIQAAPGALVQTPGSRIERLARR